MTLQRSFAARPPAALARRLWALPLGAALASGALAQGTARPAPAQPQVQPMAPCGRVDVAPVVQVSVGKSSVIRPAAPISRVLLGNPERSQAGRPAEAKGKEERREPANQSEDKTRPGVAEVDVLLLSPTEVYVLGKSIGSTNVVLLDRSGQCTAFDVVVTMDTGALQNTLAQLLPEEKNVRVGSAFDSVVLMGTVSDAAAVTRVLDLANAYVRNAGGNGASVAGANPRIVNMLSTGAPQQVMLEVKVAEVSKSLLDRFGINFSRAYAAGDGSMMRFLSGIFGGSGALGGQVSGTIGARVGGGVIGSGSNGQSTSAYTGQLGDARIGDSPQIPFAGGKNVTNFSVDAQKTDGLVKVLAEPTVMAISGQKGSFLAGGKIFIPVAQDSGSGGRSVTLEEKEFGVSVGFLPTVLDGSRVNLEVATEVSELNREGVGITAPGINGLAVLPSFTSRRAKTTVQLMDGQSFAIGGLIKNNSTANVKAFPFLGELPVVGALFRSTEFQTDKSELVFVITPRLVKPLPPNYALPTDHYVEPSRSDLHMHGRLEGQAPAPASTSATSAAPAAAAGGFQVK